MRKAVLAAAAAAVAGTAIVVAPTLAADIPPPIIVDVPPYIPPKPPAPQPMLGSLYLRGDIGYKVYSPPHGAFDVPSYGDMIDETMENTWLIGIGIGFDSGMGLRGDITIDYEAAARFSGRLICPSAPCLPGPEYSIESANIDALTILANVYFDFGQGPVRPYIGGGIGAAYVRTSAVTFVNPPPGPAGSYSGSYQWNFAWALMAGVGIDVSDNMTVDIGYRYLHLGDTHSAPIPGFEPTTITYTNIHAHEFRAGLRVNL